MNRSSSYLVLWAGHAVPPGGDRGAREPAGNRRHRTRCGRGARARLPADRAAVAARGAVGGAGHRAVRGRAGRPPRACPGCRGMGVLPGLLRGRRVGAGPGRPAGAAREDPGRGPADGPRGDRRGSGRAGPGRRPADRHLRHLRRPGGGGHPPHRPGRARPARPRPRAGHPARRARAASSWWTRRACRSAT